MDAVKEAVLEQKIDDLTLRFERAEERNREEHRQIRGEIGEVRSDLRDVRSDLRDVRSDLYGEIQHLNRTMILGFASITASVIGAVGAAIVANAV